MNVVKLIHQVAQRNRTIDFAWGVSDCLCFASEVALEIVGKDPIVHLRGTYDSEIGAQRVMVENGWRTLGDVAASIFTEIPVSHAQSGDWAFVENVDGTASIGVVIGAQIVSRAQSGVGTVPLLNASRAFRVK